MRIPRTQLLEDLDNDSETVAMKILLVHAFYKNRGGEDAVVENERVMLEDHGHRVETFFVQNDEIDQYRTLDKALLIPRTIYNAKRANGLRKRLEAGFDIVHIHNIWPTISPAVFFVLNERGQPYLQTIHNYRYIVPNAILYKEDVLPDGTLRIEPRRRNNFRDSYLLTATYWATSQIVRRLGVIDKGCGRLQLLNEFSRSIHAQRFNPEKLTVRGNFLPDRVVETMAAQPKADYYLYLGRLSEEKGVATLVDAFSRTETTAVLKIAGTGPIEQRLKQRCRGNPRIRFLGHIDGPRKVDLIARAKALVVPSEWQEVYPVTIMEANFCSTPVIASRIGGLPDMVREQSTGLLFESGDPSSLYEALCWCENNLPELVEMGKRARRFAQVRFSESTSYDKLMGVYKQIIRGSKRHANLNGAEPHPHSGQ